MARWMDNKNKEMIMKIIRKGGIYSEYQPIVCLKTGMVYGYEALSRASYQEQEFSPRELIKMANLSGNMEELEREFYTSALKNAPISMRQKIFINIEPSTISSDMFYDDIHDFSCLPYGIPMKSVVFEITENEPIEDYGIFKEKVEKLEALGAIFALDDVGTGFACIKRMSEMSPRYIKIDVDFVIGIEENVKKQHVVASIVSLASRMNARVIAEGIETKASLAKLVELGVSFGQGYLLGKPSAKAFGLTEGVIRLIQKLNTSSGVKVVKEVVSDVACDHSFYEIRGSQAIDQVMDVMNKKEKVSFSISEFYETLSRFYVLDKGSMAVITISKSRPLLSCKDALLAIRGIIVPLYPDCFLFQISPFTLVMLNEDKNHDYRNGYALPPIMEDVCIEQVLFRKFTSLSELHEHFEGLRKY